MKYTPLEGESDQESQSFEDYEALLSSNQSHKRKSSPNPFIILLSVILVLVVTLCLVGLGVWIGRTRFANPNDICPSHVQHYCKKLYLLQSNMSLALILYIAPILKEVDTTLHAVQFNGSLLKENVFRQEAGPEVDAAWASLGVHYRSIAVPPSEAAKTGLKPDQVQINEKYGGGFPANVEGLHHLHCLVSEPKSCMDFQPTYTFAESSKAVPLL